MGVNPGSHKSSTQNSNGSVARWLLPVIIAIGAGGMGITGTLLWVDSRPSTPSAASSQPMTSPANIPQSNASDATTNASATSPSTPHEPPATLTAGMTPVQASLTLGNWYYDHEAWPQAVEHYKKTIAQGLDNPDIRTDLGSALRFGGEPLKALEQYRLAQKQNPRHENSLFNQGGLYSDLKQPAKAIALWRDYIKRFPAGQSVAQARQLIAREQSKAKK